MKPSDLIKRQPKVDHRQRVIDALASGPLPQSALRLAVKMTRPAHARNWPAFLDDLAEQGLIRVWYQTGGVGRPCVMVALAASDVDATPAGA